MVKLSQPPRSVFKDKQTDIICLDQNIADMSLHGNSEIFIIMGLFILPGSNICIQIVSKDI